MLGVVLVAGGWVDLLRGERDSMVHMGHFSRVLRQRSRAELGQWAVQLGPATNVVN